MADTDNKKEQTRDAANKAKWDRFAEEYIKDLNPGAAYLRAGYRTSRETARKSAHRLMTTNEYVQKKIAKLLAGVRKRAEFDADEIVHRLEAIAGTPITKFIDINPGGIRLKNVSQLDAEELSALSAVRMTSGKDSVSVSVRLADKVKALQMLGQRFGLWDKDDAPQVVNVNVVSYADALKKQKKKAKEKNET